jgi:3-deoxy-manno-octulosonate cytidylyltransferase (CMP-KDO synthetase)
MNENIKKIVALIPTRIGSTRLPFKALLPINGMPLIIHTYRRAKLAKKLTDVIICCDDLKILRIAKKYKAKAILTSKNHLNGTERICEAYYKLKKHYDLIVDIQGDEPLISPFHIDQVINFHIKNFEADIILPTLKVISLNNPNLVKVVTNISNEVLYLSRNQIPYEFKRKNKFLKKHLSIISFKPAALKKFSMHKPTYLEKIEDIELLRALEIGLKIKTINLLGDSFSIDVLEDYKNAKKKMLKDKFFKMYDEN